jgi:hypothetical protein
LTSAPEVTGLVLSQIEADRPGFWHESELGHARGHVLEGVFDRFAHALFRNCANTCSDMRRAQAKMARQSKKTNRL